MNDNEIGDWRAAAPKVTTKGQRIQTWVIVIAMGLIFGVSAYFKVLH